MEPIWYNSYPKGMPQQINDQQFSSLVQFWEWSSKEFSSQVAFINMGKSITYAALDNQVTAFAAYLQHELKLQPGDRIAIQLPNVLQYPVVMLGALKAGLVVVNTNPLYTPREMEHQFKDSGAKAIVILENFASKLQEIIRGTQIQHVIVASMGDMLGPLKGMIVNFVVRKIKKMVPSYHLSHAIPFKKVLAAGKALTFRPVTVLPEDLAYLQYTGGTTGVAKGAMLTHHNIIANMEQIYAWTKPMFETRKEVVVTPLPLYHIFSLTANLYTFLRCGGTNILITNPRDQKAFIKELKKYPFTYLTGVNTLFNALMNNPQFSTVSFKHLKISVAGGMAAQQAVVSRWREITGKPLLEGYGLTESSPVVCFNPVDGTDQVGTIGLPLPSTNVEVVDDNGQPVPLGERGELIVQGPQVMKGYWNQPEETAKTLKNGWLYTGDIAIIQPDGFVKIVDRKKDMILVSGFNVYPNEIEDEIARHPGVLEVAAIGVPDQRTGEAVKIFVVKKNESLTEDVLMKYCHEVLTNYKCPRYISFVNELPKSNVGKILRKPLRDQELGKKA
jgi:long-chain acyl-CoA synthetase